MIKISTHLAAGLLLAACTINVYDNDDKTDYPVGTVEIGPNSFMIPLAEPLNGCKAYRHHAPGRMVAQVIYYKHPDGRFSPTKEGAICE